MNAPDISGYHAVHASLRQAAHRLADAAVTLDPGDRRRARAFRTYWQGYTGEVLAHHTVEDDYFFPALAERAPIARDHMGRLTAEHHELDALMADSTDAIAKATVGTITGDAAASPLRELAAHMDAHLDFEDADILPLFERSFTLEEYTELDKAAVKSLGLGKQAAFTVPFIAASVTPDVRDHLLTGAPVAFRILYRLTRGRYERLMTSAFDSATAASVPAAGR